MSDRINLEVHCLLASTDGDIIPSAKYMCSFWHLQPLHVTWGCHLSSMDALADIQSRSHNFPVIHPREVLLAGHWVTALPLLSLWHHPSFTSCGGKLVWGGAGTPVLYMTHTYAQGNANLWCNEKSVLVEDAWPSALVCHFVRGDICGNLMHHLPCILFPPILDLPLSLKSICLH